MGAPPRCPASPRKAVPRSWRSISQGLQASVERERQDERDEEAGAADEEPRAGLPHVDSARPTAARSVAGVNGFCTCATAPTPKLKVR